MFFTMESARLPCCTTFSRLDYSICVSSPTSWRSQPVPELGFIAHCHFFCFLRPPFKKLFASVTCLTLGRRKICEPYFTKLNATQMQNEVKHRFFGMGAMSSKPDRTPTSVRAAAAVPLVALVACALASDAHASRLPVEPGVADGELSARVGTIIKRVRAGEPTLLPQLPPEPKMAWRN